MMKLAKRAAALVLAAVLALSLIVFSCMSENIVSIIFINKCYVK